VHKDGHREAAGPPDQQSQQDLHGEDEHNELGLPAVLRGEQGRARHRREQPSGR
jgi:hypothetical protein